MHTWKSTFALYSFFLLFCLVSILFIFFEIKRLQPHNAPPLTGSANDTPDNPFATLIIFISIQRKLISPRSCKHHDFYQRWSKFEEYKLMGRPYQKRDRWTYCSLRWVLRPSIQTQSVGPYLREPGSLWWGETYCI